MHSGSTSAPVSTQQPSVARRQASTSGSSTSSDQPNSPSLSRTDPTRKTAESVFSRLGLPKNPVMLAPLAGVSDHPFRMACMASGCDLTYVEMLSATALNYRNEKTIEMLYRHPEESVLGVQLTSKTAEELKSAVGYLNDYPFETIDINMGCPVRKVVKVGCGSAILRDPERVYASVKGAVEVTERPVSAKIRLGWNHEERNYLEVSQAIESAGAAWLTVHGRTRSDDYGSPVDLEAMAEIKKALSIPVIGNGNLFAPPDFDHMQGCTHVDGWMVSRGALGNPWIFQQYRDRQPLSLEEWHRGVRQHIAWQKEHYGDSTRSSIVMRKHMIWYTKGWPGAKPVRQKLALLESLAEAEQLLDTLAEHLAARGFTQRLEDSMSLAGDRFVWDPKFDMDRKLDRGVDDCEMSPLSSSTHNDEALGL